MFLSRLFLCFVPAWKTTQFQSQSGWCQRFASQHEEGMESTYSAVYTKLIATNTISSSFSKSSDNQFHFSATIILHYVCVSIPHKNAGKVKILAVITSCLFTTFRLQSLYLWKV